MNRANPPEVRAAEKAAIAAFVMSRIRPDPKAPPLPVADLYETYKEWRAKNGLGKTKLDVGGFGRLFPKTFDRKVVWIDRATCARCVIGVKIA